MFYIIVANGAVYLVNFMLRADIASALVLIPSRVLNGELWRLITFIAVSPSNNLFFFALFLYFYYMIGLSLENQWGTFRFNIYYIIGILTTIAASFIGRAPATSVYLNTSLFLAFATLFPEFVVRLFFIIPVKMKWLGWLTWAGLAYSFIVTPSLGGRLVVVAPLLNYFLFFGKDIYLTIRYRGRVYYKKIPLKNNTVKLRKAQIKLTRHKCTVCGVSENDDPNMEFRYCSKCSGDYEYCMNHLKDHIHR